VTLSRLVLLSTIFSFFALAAPTKEGSVKGYRVVHASPYDFVNALSTPVSPRQRERAKTKKYTSRLERYFRIKYKIIEGNSVTLVILPDLPLFDTIFKDQGLITLKATLVRETATTFLYDVVFPSKESISATMLVEPHPSGSLLTLTLKHPLLDTALKTLITKTVFSMGFLAEKPELADLKN
jgi:hypothetical protein